MPAIDPLEYLEDDDPSDLFGSSPEPPELELNPLDTPGPSRRPLPVLPPRFPVVTPATSSAASSSTFGVGSGRQTRLEELRRLKAPFAEQYPSRGAASLRTFCMSVIKAHSSRIYDIGDLEYHVIKGFIDHLPMDQLSEVENNSRHLRKDTDWLWEIFLLTDFPLFHERCNRRQGEQRNRGWRRMYKKAVEDQAERQQVAMAKVAERYKQLESERASKRLVMVERLATTQKGTRRSAAAGRAGGLPPIPGPRRLVEPKIATSPKATSALTKARVDAQRARVAMTHASGRFVPQPKKPPRRAGAGSSELFSNPYLDSAATTNSGGLTKSRPKVDGRPLPRPRGSGPPASETRTSPIPGSYPTSRSAVARAALPPHLAPATAASSSHAAMQKTSATDRLLAESSSRFRAPDQPVSNLVPIKRPRVENFEPPRPKPPIIDFFGDAPTEPAPVHGHGKLKSSDSTGSIQEHGTRLVNGKMDPLPSRPPARPPEPPGTARPAPGPVEEREKLAAVLFRKKKPRVT